MNDSNPSSQLLSKIDHFDHRLWLVLLILAALAAANLAWSSAPQPVAALETLTPTPTLTAAPALEVTPTPEPFVEPSATPFPPELLNNRQQTIGISLVAAVLVLIVAVGVFAAFLREKK